MEFILSVLIPTKDRKNYLLQCVNEVLANCTEKVEVVIQDNSAEPIPASELPQATNLFYYYESTPLSFVDNFSRALENAHGQYICFIGDDDGITKYLELAAEMMKTNNIEAVSQDISVTYFWPGALPNMGKEGLLKFYYLNDSVRKIKTHGELEKLLKDGCQGYLDRALVKPYHGIVKREVFEKVKNITGQYINGLSPDIYASVALSTLISDVYVVHFPLTISGTCAKSGGAASANGSHTGKLKDAPHFKGHQNYRWNRNVPAIYSVETIWADSALHALEDICPQMIDWHFGKEYLLATCKKKYNVFKEEIMEYESQHSLSVAKSISSWFRKNVVSKIYRLQRRLTRKPSDFVKCTDVQNISEANKLTNEFIEKEHISFGTLIRRIESLKVSGDR